MAIFGALALLLPLTLAAGVYEGFMALVYRIRDRREWKRLKAYYYPNGKAWRI